MSNQWFLKVYDNFHYQDEGVTYKLGPYPSASDAIGAARGIVDGALREEKRLAQSVEQLLARYKSFGEDLDGARSRRLRLLGMDLRRIARRADLLRDTQRGR